MGSPLTPDTLSAEGETMADPSGNRHQLPFLGGALTGIGLGIWLFPILARTGIYHSFGMVGMIFVGVACVAVGMTIGPLFRSRGAGQKKDA